MGISLHLCAPALVKPPHDLQWTRMIIASSSPTRSEWESTAWALPVETNSNQLCDADAREGGTLAQKVVCEQVSAQAARPHAPPLTPRPTDT